ncbi:olfactory receptor 5AR1-like [Paroedura picta]|uniref:olfactory receptor 5AR1-like n=1 Tax=Paroedura picta TaxID=143630 RepID=UPI0040579C9C
MMDKGNSSVVTEFVLQGLTDNPQMQLPLFVIFLFIYIITVIGNLGMIVLICSQSELHNPMYFFLGNLSFLDLCNSSVIVPKMLAGLVAESKQISYNACALQLYLFILFSDIECILLGLMAYDRYVAICNPLLYTAIMSGKVCKQLMAAVYVIGAMDSIAYTYCTFRLSFCSSNIVNHFFCDIPPLLELSCSDTYFSEIVIFIFVAYVEAGSVGMILVSYAYVLSTILRMRSAESRHKAFSTCASHLTAVGIFHGTVLFMYLRPSSSYSMDQDKWASVFYTIIIPMLNPLIYSLRNKDVKHAMIKTLSHMSILKGNNMVSK